MQDSTKTTLEYYRTNESKWGYILLLKGIRHFGYYPPGKEKIPMKEAQAIMIDHLAKKLNLQRGSYILDAGCGEGWTALYLAEKYGYKVLGIDLLQESIDKAKKNTPEHLKDSVEFVCADYSKYKLPTNTFDGIYTMETLVHIKEYDKALKAFYRALKPNGKIVLSEYSITPYEKMSEKQRYIWKTLNDVTGMAGFPYFHHGTFPALLKQAGFTKATSKDITERVQPMLDIFYTLAKFPYFFIKVLGLQKKFINAFFSVECYLDMKENKGARYVVSTAQKPA